VASNPRPPKWVAILVAALSGIAGGFAAFQQSESPQQQVTASPK